MSRRRIKAYEAPSPSERRRALQAREHLEQVMDSEGSAYEPNRPAPRWPDAAPSQDRFCFHCHVRACSSWCWKCGRETRLRSLPEIPSRASAPAERPSHRRSPSPRADAPPGGGLHPTSGGV